MEERNKHFQRPTTERPPSLLNLTILTIFMGLLAGVGGYFLARTFFPLQNFDYISLISQQPEIKIDLEQPLTNFSQQYKKSIAGVYRTVSTVASVGQPLFSEDDYLGAAVVVTSDGWLMTTEQVAANENIRVALQDKIYQVTDRKIDEFSGAAFVKISETLLQPIDFQMTDETRLGERLTAHRDVPYSDSHLFATTLFQEDHYVDSLYLSSDQLDYYFKVNNSDLAQDQLGLAAPYFNLSGDLIGLSYQTSSGNWTLLPAPYLRQALTHLLNQTQRPTLGVRYVDLENNAGFEVNGNLIFHPQLAAVEYNSPAAQAGLRSGDRVIAVNNDLVSSQQSLTSIIQKYRPGDLVILKIIRNKVEEDLEVEL